LHHGRHVAGRAPVVEGWDDTPLTTHLLVEQRVLGSHRTGDLVDVVGSPNGAHEGVGGDVVGLGHHQQQQVPYGLLGPCPLPLQPSCPGGPVFFLDLHLLREVELTFVHLAVDGHHDGDLYGRSREELLVRPYPIA
jgi:hypothetical protein